MSDVALSVRWDRRLRRGKCREWLAGLVPALIGRERRPTSNSADRWPERIAPKPGRQFGLLEAAHLVDEAFFTLLDTMAPGTSSARAATREVSSRRMRSAASRGGVPNTRIETPPVQEAAIPIPGDRNALMSL